MQALSDELIYETKIKKSEMDLGNKYGRSKEK